MLERAGATVERASRADEMLSLDGVSLVVIAGLPYVDAAALSRRCQARAIPVNVVDEPRLCSFLMPAVVHRGPVTVAISTGGRSPLLAMLLRQAIDAFLPHRLGDLAEQGRRARGRCCASGCPMPRRDGASGHACSPVPQRGWRSRARPKRRALELEPRLRAIATVLEIEQR